MERSAQPDRPDPLDRKAIRECSARLDRPGRRATPGPQGPRARKAEKAIPAPRVCRDKWDRRAMRDRSGQRGHKVPRATRERKDPQDRRDLQGLKAQPQSRKALA